MQGASSQLLRRVATARAFHCLGIGTPELAGRRIFVDRSRCSGLPFGSLTALVRSVDARVWSAPSLAAQRNDLQWLRAQAEFHETVLDRALAYGGIIPMPLLSVYENLDELDNAIRQQRSRYRRLIARVGHAREWTVMCFQGPHMPPTQGPYTFRVQARPPRSRLMVASDTPGLRDAMQELFLAAGALASHTRLLESNGRHGYLFGVSFLLAEGGIQSFRKVIAKRASAALAYGVSTYLEGPRPPFTFV